MRISTQQNIAKSVSAIGVVNFLVFLMIGEFSGGFAGIGYEHAGRFFLGSHGKYTETTALFFQYSLWHERMMWLGMAAFACAIIWRASLSSRPEA